MAYAIARIKKHKSTSLGAVDSHNRRLSNTPNADPNRKAIRVVGDAHASTADLVKDKLKSLGIKSHRKDAVTAVEIVLTASPEYFRPGSPKSYGQYEPERVKEWLEATRSFLKSKYPNTLVECTVHLDEATPHVHAIVVPAIKKERKRKQKKADKELGKPHETYIAYGLSAKEMFNRDALIQQQTDYAEHCSHLGLERGERGSKAKHETIKRYYGIAERAVGTINALKRTVSDLKGKLSETLGFNQEVSHDAYQEPKTAPKSNEQDSANDYTPQGFTKE